MYQVETFSTAAPYEIKGIALDEFERVAGLKLYINTNNVKPGPVIAHPSATGTAKQIQYTKRHCVGGVTLSVWGRPEPLAIAAFWT